jgi:4-hydroxy-tetrahydrodipicolinate reductase
MPPPTGTRLLSLAAQVPCVWAGNFSVGVNLLFALTRRASQILGQSYDAEVIEMHHRFKKDAPAEPRSVCWRSSARSAASRPTPSGTAGAASPVRGRPPRSACTALRGGDVVGDHTVMFAALGERIELTHKASDRAIFAQGALRAAQWVSRQKAGVYDMQDVLGLK